MGRTNKPLTIAVTEYELLEHPVVRAWIDKGHTVFYPGRVEDLDKLTMVDLVIGERAWYMTPKHLDRYGEDALKSARARAYPKEAKS